MISIYTRSEAGSGANKDRVVYFEDGQTTVVVLADGAGGQGGGGVAAERSLEFLRDACAKQKLSPASCSQLLSSLDSELFTDRAAGESTAVMVVVRDDIVFGASVGDSEAWMIVSGETTVLTAGQYRKPLLGSGDAIPVEFGPVPLAGTLVVGTDGLFGYVGRRLIIESVGCTEKAQLAETLCEAARLPSGGFQDDTTVVVCTRRQAEVDRRKLLLVENHAVFAETVTREFLAEYEVVRVASIGEAMSVLDRAPFEAVLVDYDLDDGKGVEVVEAAKSLPAPPVIIAISAHDAGNEALLKAGAVAICKKTRFHKIGEVLALCLRQGR